MKTQIISKLKVCILLFSVVLAFSACSEDDDACLPGISELPIGALGEYTGSLTLNGTLVDVSGTATITLSGCKTYTVNFSDDVPSITGVRFIATNNGTIFTYVNLNATTTVTIDESGDLTIAQSAAPVITFNGSK